MLRVVAFLFLILCEHPTLKTWPEFSDDLQVVKAVRQNYRPTEEILFLLEDFRCMVNDCVRIGLRENVTSMKSLSMKAYHQLSAYDVPTRYRLTAISRAAGILRNYRRELKRGRSARVPYVTRPSLTDCYGFRVVHRLVRVPVKKGVRLYRPERPYVAHPWGSHREVLDTHGKQSQHLPLTRDGRNRTRRSDWN